MSTEEMIKQAFDKQAGRAGDHHRVLAEVTRRTSSRRRIGGLGITLLTAGVAAAVVTPVVLFSGSGLGRPVENGPAAQGTTQPPQRTPVLKYQPSWLPDGATEFQRISDAGGMRMRIWKVPGASSPDGGPKVTLTLEKATGLPVRPNFPVEIAAVDINGKPGQSLLMEGRQQQGVPEQALIEWMVTPGERLTLAVDYVPDVRETALRIARSIRPDGNAGIVQNVSFGWLPAGMTEGPFSVQGTTPTDYIVFADTTLAPEKQGGKRVMARIDTDKPGNGTPVSVRGKQGVHIAHGGLNGEVRVELTGGRWLTVSGPATKADLVKVADSMTIDLAARFDWIGRR